MIGNLVRAAKRFAVLIPGVIIAIISVRDIFPWFDKNLPLALAVLVTYVLAAYALIPALIRILRFIVPARHLQPYCVTPDGFASDPINIGIIGSRSELILAMKAVGWSVADDYRLANLFRSAISIALNRPYPTAPMSKLYLFGRSQDIGFEKVLNSRGQRHHVRLWATTLSNKSATLSSIEWHKARWHHGSGSGQMLWVGAASRDIGFAFIRQNFQLTHMIDADTNAERQLIVNDLESAGQVAKIHQTRLRRPYTLINRAWRGALRADGKMSVIRLKPKSRNA